MITFKRKYWALSLFYSFLILVVVGCARKVEPISFMEKKECLDNLGQGSIHPHAMLGEAIIEIVHQRKKIKTRAQFKLQDSGALFVKFTTFGFPAFYLWSQEKKINIYFPNEQNIYHGNFEGAMAALFGIHISAEQLSKLILGYRPPLSKNATVFGEKKQSAQFADVYKNERVYGQLLLRPCRLKSIHRAYHPDLAIRFEDQNKSNLTSKVEFQSKKNRLVWETTKAQENVDFKPKDLVLELPDGVHYHDIAQLVLFE